MELAAHNIAFLYCSGQLGAIFGSGHHTFVAVNGVIGVDKIDAIALFDIAQQLTFLAKMQRIPANMGDLSFQWDLAFHGNNTAPEQTQTFMLAEFIALFKQHLHT